ncbi:hypothetical protein B0H13DRAFT_2275541 [Mycena leptocephala]|nr:hypothetical protein B0H13DRAFT_2275541 [Mycena leptocephala]
MLQQNGTVVREAVGTARAPIIRGSIIRWWWFGAQSGESPSDKYWFSFSFEGGRLKPHKAKITQPPPGMAASRLISPTKTWNFVEARVKGWTYEQVGTRRSAYENYRGLGVERLEEQYGNLNEILDDPRRAAHENARASKAREVSQMSSVFEIFIGVGYSCSFGLPDLVPGREHDA